ncbi:hypothetical protein R5R35_012361 [Gryllus longicercus]|uniref:E3 ubiquitin-protein ligase RNF180 n=1 Tax=Gryllus longicercus TaxID=2509291 RepID=A0AAN9VHV6_9ORTH
MILKCRKCRKIVLEPPQIVVSAHGKIVNDEEECLSVLQNSLWYLLDDTVPKWISLAVEKDNWTRGKLSCPHCKARLGSFDFVSGSKCHCQKYILPSVHIVKEKVDCSYVQM